MSAAMAAHLSVVTAQSPSLSAARQSVLHLYRDFQRGVSTRVLKRRLRRGDVTIHPKNKRRTLHWTELFLISGAIGMKEP